MTALELFAGAGGAALGLHRAGFARVACVERNASAAATLRAAGFPAIEGDVRAVGYAAWLGRVDLLWASPPCQPGSTAGQRLGAGDERDGWPATLAAIDACRPTWFLAENVLGWTYHADLCGGSAGSLSRLPSRARHRRARAPVPVHAGLAARRRRRGCAATPWRAG